MRRTVLLAALGLLIASPGRCQVPATFPGARSLLWIGAHPDDEVLVAPLLGRLCVGERLACTFLVLTRGEAGICRLANGCHPDLGAVRGREMVRSARLFGAKLHLWDLPDGGGLAGWNAASGGGRALLDRIAGVLAAVRPDLVLTFDPRHGSTCHPDHQAAAQAALQAVERAAQGPTVYLLETRVTGGAAASPVRLSAAATAAAGVVGFDANQGVGKPAFPAWQFLLWSAQAHASQFDQPRLRGLGRVSRGERAVFLAPAALALASDDVWACD